MKAVSLYRPMGIGHAMSDLNRYLESFFDSTFVPAGDRCFGPAVDVQETDSAYVLEAELPGFDEKNIQVHVDNGSLTIESSKEENKSEKDKKDGNFLIKERRALSFSRSFKLPDNADTESVEAVFKNGVLSLEIKKRAEAKKRLIPIEAQ